MNKNISEFEFKVSCADRREKNKHNSFLVLFTGLSGAGKSTLANGLEQVLFKEHINTYVLDGDNVRRGINRNLGFSPEDRSENNRRIGEISKLFVDAGVVVLAAFISPYRKDRAYIKEIVGSDNFVEIFVNTSLKECERRDVKGLYEKARAGEINNFTGVSAPYEAPENPDIELNEFNDISESIDIVYEKIKERLMITKR